MADLEVQPLEVAADADELTKDEKIHLSFMRYLMLGMSTLLGAWNISVLQDKSFEKRSDKLFVVLNFWIYSVYYIVSNAVAHSYAEKRRYFPWVYFFTMLNFQYVAFTVCYEANRMAGIPVDTLRPIFACAATVIALVWSLYTSPEWWEKWYPHRHQE